MTKSEIGQILSGIEASLDMYVDDVDSAEDAPSVRLYFGQVEGYLNCLRIASVVNDDDIMFVLNKMHEYEDAVLFNEYVVDDVDEIGDIREVIRDYLEMRIND